LTYLNIASNAVSDEGVRRLAATSQAAGLRALALGGERLLSTASVAALAASAYLLGLRRLELPGVTLDDEAAALLARSPRLSRLREVSVDAGPELTERGLGVLERRFGAGLELGR